MRPYDYTLLVLTAVALAVMFFISPDGPPVAQPDARPLHGFHLGGSRDSAMLLDEEFPPRPHR